MTEITTRIDHTAKAFDTDLQDILQRQNSRFMILLVSAICISVAALGAVGALAYMLLRAKS